MDWKCAVPPSLRGGELDLYIYDRQPGKTILDCSLGTNPLGPPPAVHSQLSARNMKWALGAYPTDLEEFCRAVAGFWQGRVSPEEVLPGAGTMEIIFNLLRLFGHQGNVILGLCPQFPDVPQRFRLNGAEFRTVPLQSAEYRLEVEPFLGALAPDVNLAYLDHPHNPTGQAWKLSDLARVARKCEEIGALLIVDEAYGASLPEDESAIMLDSPSVVVLRSFSKIWGLAGLRAGYAVSRSPEFRLFYRKAALPVSLSIPALKLVPCVLQERGHLERTRQVFRRIKEKLLPVVGKTPGVTLAATHPTTPIFFVEPGDSGEDLFKRVLDVGLLTERGNCYEGVSPGSIRIRIPGPEKTDLFLDLWKRAFCL